MRIFKTAALALLAALLLPLGGCKVKYSLSGASISPLAKTFSVAYFPNNAPVVAPILSPTFTDGLTEKFVRQTRLSQIKENGDLRLEGEIVGYTTAPSGITSGEGNNNQHASTYRLTITVRVRFINLIEPQYNFDRTFSQYAEYDITRPFNLIESTLITQITEMLVDDIFNAATSNW